MPIDYQGNSKSKKVVPNGRRIRMKRGYASLKMNSTRAQHVIDSQEGNPKLKNPRTYLSLKTDRCTTLRRYRNPATGKKKVVRVANPKGCKPIRRSVKAYMAAGGNGNAKRVKHRGDER